MKFMVIFDGKDGIEFTFEGLMTHLRGCLLWGLLDKGETITIKRVQ